MYKRITTINIIQQLIIPVIVVLLWSGSGQAAKRDNNHYFEPLQKKLIQDGFDAKKITSLYERPDVYFEKYGSR